MTTRRDPLRLALTGAGGFLGWHLRARAFAGNVACRLLSRPVLHDPEAAAAELRQVDAVVHCAGVSRGTEEQVRQGNLEPARRVADALARVDRPVRVVYANSIHARGNGVYGTAKRKAGELLAGAAPDAYSEVVLPHLFGEHGRPYHNSFVATFCHELAAGRWPEQVQDRELTLLHAQDAAEVLLGEAGGHGMRLLAPRGSPVTVGQVLQVLSTQAKTYRSGELPDLGGPLSRQLFHTYRSHLFPADVPRWVPRQTDQRGWLAECVRSAGSGGQGFVSSTVPGALRGDHVHLRKLERFVVLYGRAEITLRQMISDRVVRLPVAGDRTALVDIPTFWTHRLTAAPDGPPVVTFFWTSECYQADDPDTFGCPVFAAADGAGS